MAEQVLEGLEPESVFRHFAAISAIPRCSKKEAAVRDYVVSVADGRGYSHRIDSAGNLVVRVPSSPDRSGVAPVCLQGHLDMVCEKNVETDHDFEKQALKLRRNGEWLSATETTLGADNGIAVAMMLAAMEYEGSRPPLELLFTVDEESGLIGAVNLDPTLLSARRLINIDTEEEGHFCIGCAGGRNTEASLKVGFEQAPPGTGFRIVLTGLAGGHSGITIHEGRGNAVVFGARILDALSTMETVRIADAYGGDKHNAIPREFRITGVVASDGADALKATVIDCERIFQTEIGDLETELAVGFEILPSAPEKVLSAGSQLTLTRLLRALPHGVLSMSRAVPGLVESSTNLAAVKIVDGTATILTSQRSSHNSLVDAAARAITAVVALAGGTTAYKSGYPGWAPNPDSRLLETFRAAYRSRYGTDAHVEAVHAGLECGVIGDKVPGMEMISFGPDIEGAHTPQERVRIPSVARSWDLLLDVLARLD